MNNLLQFITTAVLIICGFTAMAQDQSPPLKLKYLGTAGWIINDGAVTVLVDPYISRVKLGTGPGIHPDDNRSTVMRSDHYASDTLGIDSLITSADYILVHHSHFDHLADVPYIAQKTGAKVVGTETSCNILRGYGIPDEQLYPVKGGEDYQFENFSIRVIPGIHSALNEKHYIDSRTYTEPPQTPLKVSEFIEGGSLMFLLRFARHEVMTMGSMNFLEREVQGIRPDVLLAGVNRSQLGLYKYNERLLAATGNPAVIIPTHWDNFRLPYGFNQQDAVEQKLWPFRDEVKKLSPNTKVIIPQHLGVIELK